MYGTVPGKRQRSSRSGSGPGESVSSLLRSPGPAHGQFVHKIHGDGPINNAQTLLALMTIVMAGQSSHLVAALPQQAVYSLDL